MRPRLTIHHLLVGAPGTGPRRRYLHRRQDFVIGQDVFLGRVPTRQREELTGRDAPVARRTADVERRAQRDQGWRGVRWMDDIAGSAAEDGVELVLAGK